MVDRGNGKRDSSGGSDGEEAGGTRPTASRTRTRARSRTQSEPRSAKPAAPPAQGRPGDTPAARKPEKLVKASPSPAKEQPELAAKARDAPAGGPSSAASARSAPAAPAAPARTPARSEAASPPPPAEPSQPAATSKSAPASSAPGPLPPLADEAAIWATVNADHRDPFGFLGMHRLTAKALVVRVFLPGAQRVAVVDAREGGTVTALDRLHDDGLFAGAITGRSTAFRYRLRVLGEDGDEAEVEDPYCFPPILTETDADRLADGSHRRGYRKLGAHPVSLDGVPGVTFAVWAPNAFRVAVVGDFNDWDGRRHGMRLRHECGVWEIFIPHAETGQFYKYEIKAVPNSLPLLRADPVAFRAERWPGTASVVADLGAYTWGDQAWMSGRGDRHRHDAPLAIYEVHLGSWRRKPEDGARWLSYREMAEELPRYVKEMGFTHVELLPVAEFNFDGSLGYHPIALFAPTNRFGDPDDLRLLIDRCHQEGIGVILNWVAVEFPDDPQAPGQFDGAALYEHPDPKQQRHPHANTLMYDYGRPGVAAYLLGNALFWLDQYHVDGLRLDGLAAILYLDYGRAAGEWSRNRFGGHENLEAIDFVRHLNEAVYTEEPGAFTIAEEESGWPMVSRPTFLGGLGFGYKWNEVWLHETLRYMARPPIHKRYYHEELTHGPAYAFQENHVIALSHDQVTGGKGPLIGRMPGMIWDKFANLRLYYAMVYTQPAKKLVFMGNEFAPWHEWSHELSLDWHLLEDPLHKGVQLLVGDLNRAYVGIPALHEGDCEESGFAWIDANDTDQSVISYLRFAKDGVGVAAVVCNFTPVVRSGYRIGVPSHGYYAERINTDSARYGGSNAGNEGGMWAEEVPMHGRPCSLTLTLPPFAAVVLERTDAPPAGET